MKDWVIKSRVKKVYANPSLDEKIAAGLRAHPTWSYVEIAAELGDGGRWKEVARQARRLGLKR